ncbi:MAG: NAD(P)-dependent oxidoreductase [Pyrinomonadaceae bacterium]
MKATHPIENNCVMVTGGAGFVGSALVRELFLRRARVVVYDNFLHGARANLPPETAGADSLTVVSGDVLDVSKLTETIKTHDVRYIINCAGDTFVPTAYEIPQRFFDVNLQGAFNVLTAAKTCAVERVLHVSSTEVYGEHRGEPISEDFPLAPLNTYAVSKLAADRLCFTFFAEHRIPVVIARIFNCFGPRETHPYIIPEIISQLNKSASVSLGNVEAERDFTYVHDTARALIALLASNVPNGEAVNVGTGKVWKVSGLVRIIAEIMNIDSVEIERDSRRLRRLDIDRFQCDNSKLRRYTDWSPQVDLYEGLRRTIEWFKENNCQWSWEKSSNDVVYAQPVSDEETNNNYELRITNYE